MSNSKVIIVEDDEITSLNLKMSLQKQGYTVVATCNNATSARQEIEIQQPGIIIIDISLDESSDGIDLARFIRHKYKIPFIFLTSHSDNDIIAEAITTEPYGYIVKPFDPTSLHATIQMALFKLDQEQAKSNNVQNQRIDTSNLEELLYAKREDVAPIVTFGESYHLDINVCETYYNNKKMKLTKKENAFLCLLVAKLGSIVNFEQAMNYVWQKNGATENSVRTLVWRLRNKLDTDIIKNASGIGYYIEE